MSATDELSRLLSERGVEYQLNEVTKIFEWHFDGTDGEGSAHAAEVHGGINIIACSLTPEQAVEATLGRGECHLMRHGSLADWPDMVCWSCSVCNFGWHHDVNDKQFSYCPNCGARVTEKLT